MFIFIHVIFLLQPVPLLKFIHVQVSCWIVCHVHLHLYHLLLQAVPLF